MTLQKAFSERQLTKAKYLKRWKGKDGKWKYAYRQEKKREKERKLTVEQKQLTRNIEFAFEVDDRDHIESVLLEPYVDNKEKFNQLNSKLKSMSDDELKKYAVTNMLPEYYYEFTPEAYEQSEEG